MIFTWVLEDVMTGIQDAWAERGFGIDVNGYRLPYPCWAGGTGPVSRSVKELTTMVAELKQDAAIYVGLHLRLNKCRWREVCRAEERT